ncbi:MAG: VOC family protein [Proteobacteria bacterium]|nr:VOC family protein [Pseudomonadota bacterium]HQR03153.1 VOC family protein [Rhodocyclaceae bacterium]
MNAKLILIPVTDLGEAIDFYVGQLGLKLKFRDGERYAALDAAPLSIGLVANEERIVTQPAVVFPVMDVDSEITRLTGTGARVLLPAESGPHERRAVLAGPDGQPFVISAKIAQPG